MLQSPCDRSGPDWPSDEDHIGQDGGTRSALPGADPATEVDETMLTFNKGSRDKKEGRDASLPENTQQVLAAADQARDERRWAEAADLYGKYLASRPADSAIWVQFGHALKESGNFGEAEKAYLHSLELAPRVADTHLQLGHLYKKSSNFSKAIEAYREALKADGSLSDARRELISLGVSPEDSKSLQAASTRSPGTFIDLSDVFFYLRHHQTVSGIQRVQLGIAKAIIAMSPQDRSSILFLSESDDRRSYVVIDDVFVSELAKELGRTEVVHDRLLAIMRSAIECARTYEPVAKDTLLILGAFWVLENIAERIIALRRKGVFVGTLIHDIIPITHPEFCEKSLTDAFKSYFFSVLSVVDFILTVSDYSGRCVQDFMTRNAIPKAPIRTLGSAHWTLDAPADAKVPSPAIERLLKEDYVLYVSTIEIRKNHTYLFRIWKRLTDERGKNVPRLVFVGRPGWRVRDLMDQLESTANLDGRILILHDLSDSTLAALYRGSLFTVFPSFEEGWGLPVGESLLFGRPCIAANASSIPEVAGDFVDYVDPFNLKEGYEKIVRFIDDKKFREQRAEYIKENFKPRTWQNVAQDMLDIVRSLVGDADNAKKPVEPPRLKPGIRYQFGHADNVSHFINSGAATVSHFSFIAGWYPVENFGRWARGPHASIEFLVEWTGDQPILVVIETSTVDWLRSTQLQITVNGVAYEPITLVAGARKPVLLRATPTGGKVVLEFSPVGDIVAGSDPRKDLWFGLCSIGYANGNDVLSRVMLLEAYTYGATPIEAPSP